MTFLGLIPARGGSKGIPRKNLADLAGRPLLSYTVEAAKGSRRLSRVCVTTDDELIAAEAAKDGAEVIRRPPALAQDRSPMIEAARHALNALKDKGFSPDAVVLLQPTSPLRTRAHIAAACELFVESAAESLLSVNPASQNPCECVRREGGRLKSAVPVPAGARGRQDFPEYFYVNGAIYITRAAMLEERGLFWDDASELYVMDPLDSIDVDGPEHLAMARALVEARRLAPGDRPLMERTP
ncbi:MAG: acylneuraminate cytidylyltransferase family protein [Elusimicrobia bacterium]|nr:acylneuraminate cytidylyltransferase family protein [Elusimicrobiota bacterium]